MIILKILTTLILLSLGFNKVLHPRQGIRGITTTPIDVVAKVILGSVNPLSEITGNFGILPKKYSAGL
jgi:hypothetical protein